MRLSAASDGGAGSEAFDPVVQLPAFEDAWHFGAPPAADEDERLERMSSIKNEFVSIVSHEFRTALTGIQGFSELLRAEDLTNDEVRDFTGDISTNRARAESQPAAGSSFYVEIPLAGGEPNERAD